MIKFFRNIRKKLLKEGKTTKYFKYAIGEIILVVIGILIALQLNTWKEENNTKKLETKIIKELQSNLKLDLKEIQHDIEFMDDINMACSNITNYLKKNEIASDSFFKIASILRVTPHFDPNTSGYGLLQSKGVEVISNDSLRNAISLLYERSYPYYKRYEEERLRFHALHSEPKLLEYFDMKFALTDKYYGAFYISAEDYKTLQKDSSFLKLLSAIAFENSAVQNRGERTEASIISLLEFLQKELEENGDD
ncbi:DUF6090 family protein [Algibacter sp.]|uniref:DUF6090 family protein n=1 Tax=Algibacter sp. TaxID=1872428 RepID=UPI003C70727B